MDDTILCNYVARMAECLERTDACKSSIEPDDCKFRGHMCVAYHIEIIFLMVYHISDGVIAYWYYILWTNLGPRRRDEYQRGPFPVLDKHDLSKCIFCYQCE